MKTLLRLALACTLILVFTACDNQQRSHATVEAYVQEAQQNTPLKVDDATTLTEVAIEGSNVVYHYLVDESMITIEAFSGQENLIRETFNDRRNNDEATRQFVEACVDAKLGIIMTYTGNVTHDTFTVSFPLEEPAEAPA